MYLLWLHLNKSELGGGALLPLWPVDGTPGCWLCTQISPPATFGLFCVRVHHLCRYVDPIQTCISTCCLRCCILDEVWRLLSLWSLIDRSAFCWCDLVVTGSREVPARECLESGSSRVSLRAMAVASTGPAPLQVSPPQNWEKYIDVL